MIPLERRAISVDFGAGQEREFKLSDEEAKVKAAEEAEAELAEFDSLSHDPEQYLGQCNTILRLFDDNRSDTLSWLYGESYNFSINLKRDIEGIERSILHLKNAINEDKTLLGKAEESLNKPISKRPILDIINSIAKSFSETIHFLLQDTTIHFTHEYKPLFDTELEQLPSDIQLIKNRITRKEKEIATLVAKMTRMRRWIAYAEQFTKNDGCLHIISGLFQNSRVVHLDEDLIGRFGALSEKVEHIKNYCNDYCFVVHANGRNFYIFTPPNDCTKRMMIYKATKEDYKRILNADSLLSILERAKEDQTNDQVIEDQTNEYSYIVRTHYHGLNKIGQIGQLIGEFCGLEGDQLAVSQQLGICFHMFKSGFYKSITNPSNNEPTREFATDVQAIQYCQRQDKIKDIVAGFLGNPNISKMVTDYAWSSVQDPETLNLLYADEMVSTLDHYLGRNLKNLVLTYLQEQEPNTSTTTTTLSSTGFNHITSTTAPNG